MINLLPYNLRRQIKARQHNNILIKSFFVLTLAVIILAVTYSQLNKLSNDYFIEATKKNSVITAKEKTITKQSFKLLTALNTVQIYKKDQELSDYILEIINHLPKDITLQQLSVKLKDITNKQIKLTCFSGSPSSFNDLKTAFQSSNLIKKLKISSISETENNSYSATVIFYLNGETNEK